MKQYSIYEIAEWLLSKESMTPKKLQKLSYYIAAWAHALYDYDLVEDTEFEAWVHGPVAPELYTKYRDYGWREIEQATIDESLYDDKALDLFESVWITYGDKSANELEALTHMEEPWRKARAGLDHLDASRKAISKDDMRDYYRSIYIGD